MNATALKTTNENTRRSGDLARTPLRDEMDVTVKTVKTVNDPPEVSEETSVEISSPMGW
jgi:hypothetical protein